jgi:hypothetical protein
MLTGGGHVGERGDDVDEGDGGGAAVVREPRGDPPRGEAAAAAAGAHGHGHGRRRAARGHARPGGLRSLE